MQATARVPVTFVSPVPYADSSQTTPQHTNFPPTNQQASSLPFRINILPFYYSDNHYYSDKQKINLLHAICRVTQTRAYCWTSTPHLLIRTVGLISLATSSCKLLPEPPPASSARRRPGEAAPPPLPALKLPAPCVASWPRFDPPATPSKPWCEPEPAPRVVAGCLQASAPCIFFFRAGVRASLRSFASSDLLASLFVPPEIMLFTSAAPSPPPWPRTPSLSLPAASLCRRRRASSMDLSLAATNRSLSTSLRLKSSFSPRRSLFSASKRRSADNACAEGPRIRAQDSLHASMKPNKTRDG